MSAETLVSLPKISRNDMSRPSLYSSSSNSGSTSSCTSRQALRGALSRSSTLGSNETKRNGSRTECLTSLSALYRSTYKPYQFTHMYGTHYNQDFQGRFVLPPQPERQISARYAPVNYLSLKTTYQEEFRDQERIGKPLILPCSKHRRNKPHPQLRNTWNYPNTYHWIWSGKNHRKSSLITLNEEMENRKAKSAGVSTGAKEIMRTHRWCSR
ncbi:uncharacterized protein LOC124445581 isoform X2 [Xenia sp. Carnegie-2017]|uniref:uncharacterized protein LOC124445581 isoform X2 n=1 Tax=Xenia sp. Carnegie-2017 TaxID=2897299 RepID=UPI001F037503|nr:uncharacterized protein LOC124445581 isoform X2 [Xenia sp. Carnegie-2017]